MRWKPVALIPPSQSAGFFLLPLAGALVGNGAHGNHLFRMLEPTPFDKAATCRRRAKQARRKAATVEDELAREALLKVAETWDHMAAFEETLGPWRPRDPQ